MRTIDPENPLASTSDLIEDALKVLAEVEGPIQPLKELLERLKGWKPLKDCEDDIEDAHDAVLDLEDFFKTEDDNLRGFTRDLNYIREVLDELETRSIEEREEKLRKRDAFFTFDDHKMPPQEM